MDINWEELKDLAISAMEQAYCPYSGFPVGAAGLTTDGHTYSGCNVENAGYGITLCAECGMVSQMVRSGGEPVAPCGRCRQLIFEHGGNDCLVLMPDGVMSMKQVLPGAFGPHDLTEVASARFVED